MPERQDVKRRIGEPTGLQFEFSFSGAETGRGADRLPGSLVVWLGEHVVWGRYRDDGELAAVDWDWIELLEHLAAHWKYLRHEQGYPFGVEPFRPSGLWIELQRRWNFLRHEIADEESTAYGFRTSHDLSHALQGCVVPPLWIVREGRVAIVESGDSVLRLAHDAALRVLEDFGNLLCDRLRWFDTDRARTAAFDWERRDDVQFEERAEIATGLDQSFLDELAAGQPLWDAFAGLAGGEEGIEAAFDLAYRCKGGLSAGALRPLLGELAAQAPSPSPALEELSSSLKRMLTDLGGFRPFVQGHKLALKLRHDPALFADRTGRADPERILRDLGVALDRRDLGCERFDAVAFWGAGRGPRVLVNRNAKHETNSGAERATVAHELCHLLVDRDTVLPWTAVVGGVMDREAEQRANAFAAELLCPRFWLRSFHAQSACALEVVAAATERFGVSRELVALQLARCNAQLTPTDEREIESCVSPHAVLPWRERD